VVYHSRTRYAVRDTIVHGTHGTWWSADYHSVQHGTWYMVWGRQQIVYDTHGTWWMVVSGLPQNRTRCAVRDTIVHGTHGTRWSADYHSVQHGTWYMVWGRRQMVYDTRGTWWTVVSGLPHNRTRCAVRDTIVHGTHGTRWSADYHSLHRT